MCILFILYKIVTKYLDPPKTFLGLGIHNFYIMKNCSLVSKIPQNFTKFRYAQFSHYVKLLSNQRTIFILLEIISKCLKLFKISLNLSVYNFYIL